MQKYYLTNRRIDVGLSQTALADKLGYTVQSISQWENGKSYPPLPLWSKYASLLEVDLESFLLEKNHLDDHLSEEKTFDIDAFAKYLTILRKRNGLTQKHLADLLGVSKRTIISYEKGFSTPNKKQFIILCNLYKITANTLYFAIKENIVPKDKRKIILPIIIPIIITLTTGGTIGTLVAIERNKSQTHHVSYSEESQNSSGTTQISNSEEITTSSSEESAESSNSSDEGNVNYIARMEVFHDYMEIPLLYSGALFGDIKNISFKLRVNNQPKEGKEDSWLGFWITEELSLYWYNQWEELTKFNRPLDNEWHDISVNIPNSPGRIVFLYEINSYNEGATIDIDDIVVTYYGGATVTETFEYPD